MRFLTADEATSWASGRQVVLDQEGRPAPDLATHHHVRFLLPQTPGQITWLSRFVSDCLGPREEALLWVTTWGVWRSSENWHLYYRLRQSYGDPRLLHEAPGHLFLDFEAPDLISFLQIGTLFGWDMHLLPMLNYGGSDTARAFISHDEWVVLSHQDPAIVREWRDTLTRAEYRILSPDAA